MTLFPFLLADQLPTPDPLVSYLTSAGVIGLLALAVAAFLRGWIVPGSQFRKSEKENEELRVFMREQMVPLLTRVNDVVVKILEERAWDERLQARRPKS